MAISSIFDLARRSLAVYQYAMDATSHNIANSSNPDYSRQQVIFSTERPLNLNNFTLGMGVKIDQLLRVRDDMTDRQIRTNNQNLSFNSKQSEILGQVETLFSEPSDLGLSSLTTDFFNSWNELAVTPNSQALRQEVVRSAQRLADKVGSINDGLKSTKSDLLNEAKGKVDEINASLKQIQAINQQIYESQAAGYGVNDLLDQRDKLLGTLSQDVNINVTYDSDNMANVSIGGVFAADRVSATEFKLGTNNDKLTLVTIDGNNSSKLTGGELYGITNNYSTNIPKYQDNIDSLVNALVSRVNAVHQQGYTITDPPVTNVNFFEGYENGVLKINNDILQDTSNIAVSADGTEGNGDIAVAIAGISEQQIFNGMTISDGYSTLVSQIGTDKLSADQSLEANQMIDQQLQQRKAQISGVSIDEEMTNVIQYQKSYEASAKLITISNNMLDTLLNLVG